MLVALKKGFAISRIIYLSLVYKDKFFLRLLFTIVPGLTSFEDL